MRTLKNIILAASMAGMAACGPQAPKPVTYDVQPETARRVASIIVDNGERSTTRHGKEQITDYTLRGLQLPGALVDAYYTETRHDDYETVDQKLKFTIKRESAVPITYNIEDWLDRDAKHGSLDRCQANGTDFQGTAGSDDHLAFNIQGEWYDAKNTPESYDGLMDHCKTNYRTTINDVAEGNYE